MLQAYLSETSPENTLWWLLAVINVAWCILTLPDAAWSGVSPSSPVIGSLPSPITTKCKPISQKVSSGSMEVIRLLVFCEGFWFNQMDWALFIAQF